jgi:hypothetical protein
VARKLLRKNINKNFFFVRYIFDILHVTYFFFNKYKILHTFVVSSFLYKKRTIKTAFKAFDRAEVIFCEFTEFN